MQGWVKLSPLENTKKVSSNFPKQNRTKFWESPSFCEFFYGWLPGKGGFRRARWNLRSRVSPTHGHGGHIHVADLSSSIWSSYWIFPILFPNILGELQFVWVIAFISQSKHRIPYEYILGSDGGKRGMKICATQFDFSPLVWENHSINFNHWWQN